MTGAPPLRFLLLVVGGWVCLRAAMLAPDWPSKQPAGPELEPGRVAQKFVATSPALLLLPQPERARGEPPLRLQWAALGSPRSSASAPTGAAPTRQAPAARPAALPLPAPSLRASAPPASSPPPFATAVALVPELGRWSGSAWAFVRQGGGAQLSAGGMLGGSQAGARLAYRLNGDSARPLSLTARLSSPLSRPRGAEAALGLEWKPLARLHVRLLVERRQAIGKEGRSAFAAMAYGGVSDFRVAGPVLLDAFAQAGVVGLRSRDLFADGALQLSLPVDEDSGLRAGAGVWGAAQPGLARLDVGPQASMRLPVAGRSVRVSAEWRFRVAGEAAPRSGPALTLSTDF